MTLLTQHLSATVNPIGDLGANADECLQRLVLGSNIKYISVELFTTLKAIALDALVQTPNLAISDLVACWRKSQGSATNGVHDFANAVSAAFLPS